MPPPAAREPRVSILLPARDAADTLEEALAGLRAQTESNWECLLVDDRSRDATAHIATCWARRDPRIRLLSTPPPGGLVAALNAAVAAARAPLLARQDADDRSHPERLARSLALLEGDPRLGAVATQVRLFPSASSPPGLRRYVAWLNRLCTPEEIAQEIWIESPLPHPATLIRGAALRAAGGYRAGPWPEDYDLWLRLHLAGWRFAKVPQVLYDWRHQARRLTFRDRRYRPAAFLACKLAHLTPRLRDRPLLIWGAGRDGRRLGRALRAAGHHPIAFIDIDPAKIGRQRLGLPVRDPSWLARPAAPGQPIGAASRLEIPPRSLLLVAVGTPGARALLRARLAVLGWREDADFLCLH